MKLKNKVILIVGGTKGVGKAVAIEASKNGALVIIAGRDKASALEIIKKIQILKGEAYFEFVDVDNLDSLCNLFLRIQEKYIKLDALFYYAGITDTNDILNCTEEHFNSIINTNLRGALFSCKHSIEIMKNNRVGSIVLNGSPHAWAGEKDRIVYAVSKGALLTLSNHISIHYAKYGIRSNYITMGWTPTEGEIALRNSEGISENELRILAASVIPAGRMTEIEDIVPSIIYLFSDDSKMVSGSNLRITGGWFI
jgi:NAD(P)-dependent dehydrogenase (short-subunit alcohol dehydrogenase family)